MKKTFTALVCAFAVPAFANPGPCQRVPELVKVTDQNAWTLPDREVKIEKDCVAKDGKPSNGILWLDAPAFSDGTIEVDIKGKDEQGKSFVGVAFHASDETHYDAVYFRPFNFRNPDRQDHSIQYISPPAYEWFTLREKWPGKYENKSNVALDPDAWFHVRIDVTYPLVKVFVNGNAAPSLTVTQLSSARQGMIGLWTGNNEGNFKNLSIKPAMK